MPPKIEKRNTSEKNPGKQIKIKKFAKDDTELLKIRRQKMRKELEKILPKCSKDDFEILKIKRGEIENLEEYLPKNTLEKFDSLVSSVEKFSGVNLVELSPSNLKEYVSNLEKIFNDMKSMTKSLELPSIPMVKHIEDMSKLTSTLSKLDIPNEKILSNIENEIKSISNKIETELASMKE